MIKYLEYDQDFYTNIKSASECSEDHSNGVRLVSSLLGVVNFDAVAGIFASRQKQSSIRSADSFLYLNNSPVFIEFKNEDVLNPKNKKIIIEKFYKSLMIYCFYADCHYDYFKNNVIFVLVYKDKKISSSPLYKTKKHLASLSNSNLVLRGFSELKSICKDIITLSELEFELATKNFQLISRCGFSYTGKI